MVRWRCKEGALELVEFVRAGGRPVVGSKSGKGSSHNAVVGDVLSR